MLASRANIDDLGSGRASCFELVPLQRRGGSVEDVVADVSGDVDCILGRTKLRGIGQLEVHEVVDGQAAVHCRRVHRRRDHVDALVNAILAICLCAKNAP